MTTEQKLNFPDHIIKKAMDVVANISQYPDVPVLICVRGLPGSGKSTFAKFLEITFKTLQRQVSVHEADQYFYNEAGEYKFDPASLHKAHYWCRKNAAQNLKDGNIVIVSNTFTTRKELNEYIEVSQEKHAPMVLFALKNSFGSIHWVPDDKLKQMAARWVDIEREIVLDYDAIPPESISAIVDESDDQKTVLGHIDSHIADITIPLAPSAS